MTRHSLGFLLSERAKAQKKFVPAILQHDNSSEDNLLTSTQQEALETTLEGAVVNRDATPDTSTQVDVLRHEEHLTQQ